MSGWVNDPALSGGRLTSSLVHSIDLMRYLAGSEIVRVQAEGGNLAVRGLNQLDNAVATVRFANGAIGVLLHGTAGRSDLLSNWSFQTIGVGTNATLYDHCRQAVLHIAGAEPESVVDLVADPFQVGMRPMIDEFAAAVARGVADRATPRDGTVSLAICRAIETAIASGQAQDIAPLR
jgi:predicted dehydrogenase